MAGTPNGLVINPNIGTYDVRVVVGASFATQRTQAQAAFTDDARQPDLMPAIAPLWAQTLDVPHADKLAQVLTAVAAEVKAILQPQDSEGPTTADLTAKVQQLTQALQAAIQTHQAQQDADEAHAAVAEAKANADARRRSGDQGIRRAHQAPAQVLGATITPDQVQAIVQQTLAQTLAQPSPTRTGRTDRRPRRTARRCTGDGRGRAAGSDGTIHAATAEAGGTDAAGHAATA